MSVKDRDKADRVIFKYMHVANVDVVRGYTVLLALIGEALATARAEGYAAGIEAAKGQ